MKKITLYYATNRNHIGNDRWKPKGYGKNFSADRSDNLRFGKVELSIDDNKVEKYLKAKKNGRHGDGEGLSEYLIKHAKSKAKISAFKDVTTTGHDSAKTEQLASTRSFQQIKKLMDKKQDVLINIHGFNVSWWEAVGSAMALELMLNRQPENDNISVFLFTWPSNGKMLKGKAYSSDRKDAKDSGLAVARGFLKLRDFLMTLRAKTSNPDLKECGQQLHLLCHSMGNYVLQNTLLGLQQEIHSPALPRLFKNIFMCAPDVADSVFEIDQPMRNTHELCQSLNIYYNNGDMAMYISDYTKGNSDRLGHAGAARPNQLHNKIRQINCSKIVGGMVEHSYYLWATVNDDIRQTIDNLDELDDSRKRKLTSNNTSVLL